MILLPFTLNFYLIYEPSSCFKYRYNFFPKNIIILIESSDMRHLSRDTLPLGKMYASLCQNDGPTLVGSGDNHMRFEKKSLGINANCSTKRSWLCIVDSLLITNLQKKVHFDCGTNVPIKMWRVLHCIGAWFRIDAALMLQV